MEMAARELDVANSRNGRGMKTPPYAWNVNRVKPCTTAKPLLKMSKMLGKKDGLFERLKEG